MKAPSFTSEERLGPLEWCRTETWLLKPAGVPVSFLNPTSGPGSGFSPSSTPHSQELFFFHCSYTFCGKQPFCSRRFVYLEPESASTNFKVLQRWVRPPVKPVNVASQQLVEGWDFYFWLSETQSGATFEACQSTGPRGKAYCPQIDPTPLVLFI